MKRSIVFSVTVAAVAGVGFGAGLGNASTLDKNDAKIAVRYPDSSGPQAAWNSCYTVPYKVNLNGVPKRELKVMKAAFRKVEKVSSLRFKYAGATSEIAGRNGSLMPEGDFFDAEHGKGITVAFAAAGNSAKKSPYFLRSPGAAGLGGWSGETEGTVDSTSGFVLINKKAAGTVSAAMRKTLYAHEIGHAVGLVHERKQSNVMFPSVSRPLSWGKGDLRQFKTAGKAGRPCLPSPPLPVSPEAEILEDSGNLVLEWYHNPAGLSDPAGANRQRTTSYTVYVNRGEGTPMIKQFTVPAPSADGTQKMTAVLGTVVELAPVDPGPGEVFSNHVNAQVVADNGTPYDMSDVFNEWYEGDSFWVQASFSFGEYDY